jgi:hypothetical protein
MVFVVDMVGVSWFCRPIRLSLDSCHSSCLVIAEKVCINMHCVAFVCVVFLFGFCSHDVVNATLMRLLLK